MKNEHNRRGPRKIAIADGYTAGHVMTGVAVAEAYQALGQETGVVFLGSFNEFLTRALKDSGFGFHNVRCSAFSGRSPGGKITCVAAALAGAAQARRVLKQEGAELVLGLGGYASVPGILAGKSLGLPLAIHEANVDAGLANRLLARLADRVYLGWASAAATFPNAPTLTTGNPVRRDIQRAHSENKAHEESRSVLVIGGSGGSPFLNEQAPELLRAVADRGAAISVRHQTGRCDPAPIAAAYEQRGLDARVQPHFDCLPTTYRDTHFAVTCAGAVTFSELATAGIPSLLVPLRGATRDHQAQNAALFASESGCIVSQETEWDCASLANRIAEVLSDAALWARHSERMQTASTPNAAQRIVEDCQALFEEKTNGKRITPGLQ